MRSTQHNILIFFTGLPMLNSATQPTLLWNESPDHGSAVKMRLKDAERFTCMVAFANTRGFSIFESELRNRIDKGMSAIFVVGIDFYQSEPAVLDKLLRLMTHGDLKVYMGNFERRWTFHPKLYLFESSHGTSAIVGSANMTGGGLADNHELSVAFDHGSGDLGKQIETWIEGLIADREIVKATDDLVKEYARRHAIYSRQMTIGRRRAERAAVNPHGGRETLAKILEEMKADASEEGFDSSVERRAQYGKEGRKILDALASDRQMNPSEFLSEYERLITTMHSGGLHRGKTTVASSRAQFRDGLRSLLKLKDRDPAVLFEHLRSSFEYVDRAGTNVITELLHLLDSKRYAVMNRNSVSGLGLAGISAFPERPTKRNVDGETYALFCAESEKLRKDLALRNFSELDAVFNYAYWRDLEE